MDDVREKQKKNPSVEGDLIFIGGRLVLAMIALSVMGGMPRQCALAQ